MDYQTSISNLSSWFSQTLAQSWTVTDTLLVVITAILTALAVILISRSRNERRRYEFITIIAHKFRTPLTHIKWSTENILEGNLDAYQKQGFADIRNANEKLIKLTGTLIELTDSESGAKAAYKFERVNACEIMRAAVAEAKSDFREKNLFITAECADSALFVRADRARLRFVIDIALENACLYSPAGRNVTLGLERRGRKCVISVADNGIGIEQGDMPRVFTKFFRAKNARAMNVEGLGIGLFMARSIVKRHGGKIKVSSDGAGRGTTVSVTLPRVK